MRQKPELAVIILVSTFAFLGLAIFAFGGVEAFFSHQPLTVLTGVVLAFAIAALFTEGNLSSGEREDRDNRWVISALGGLGLALAFLPALADRYAFWTIDGEGLRWLGVILFGAGGILRLWPVFLLGSRFSGLVAIQPGHRLVTTGIYSIIRHPSYLGALITSLGWALAFRSGVGILLTLLLIPPLVARIRAEEKLLMSHFGAEYEAYRARTSRLLPGVY
ncbi:MAG TPA: isoprenylcysteine carboxylmethyltransferase family protein [Methylocella sp.]|nr:isoprenylcysteine carboxylmethyltransferase family protein [Methylocella sp.]